MENDNKENKNKTGWPADSEEPMIGPINKRQFIMIVVGGMAMFIAQKVCSLKVMLAVVAIVVIIIIKLWNKSPNKPA
ncbi:MAG TPA: hypothetical protein P5267_02540 [Patescibacteria group bacterium]|nr:hypothetical protein [Patescibacteria group bacterium]